LFLGPAVPYEVWRNAKAAVRQSGYKATHAVRLRAKKAGELLAEVKLGGDPAGEAGQAVHCPTASNRGTCV